MTSFLLYLLLWIWDNRSFDAITNSNRAKSNAESAYLGKDYRRAADLYHKITYGSLFTHPASRLYLAHSYFQLDSLAQAQYQYKLLMNIDNKSIASRANAQLALLAVRSQDTTLALNYLKTALRQEPLNRKARYNYELLKKTFSGRQPPPPPEQKASPPPKQEPIPLSPQQASPELAEQREELLQRLRRLNMSEDQARSILDAMKSNETQYIYQLRRRQYHNQAEKSPIIEW